MKKQVLIAALILFSSIAAASQHSNSSGFLSSLPDIKIEDSDQDPEDSPGVSFYWIIILGIITAIIAIYSFDIDPLKIIAGIGILLIIHLAIVTGLLQV